MSPREESSLHILKELRLEQFYPSKISLPMINEINTSIGEEVTKVSVPWRLLRKLMNLNYKGREEDLNALYESFGDTDDFSDSRSEITAHKLHPLDVFLLTFMCCDPILQQELVSKMFVCRIAVPFIYQTMKDELMMSKWALRKIVFNRKMDGTLVEHDALSQFVKTVAFIRIGPQTLSKSTLMNEILSDQKHCTFFSRKTCISFETQKSISDGIVEASWFIPSNRSDDNSISFFDDVVMFLNLRGDCMDHVEQLETVSAISDVIIVQIGIESLHKLKIVGKLEQIHLLQKYMIYALECKSESIIGDNIEKVRYFKAHFKVNEDKTKFLKVEGEISLALVKKFRHNISEYLSNTKARDFSEVISNITFSDDNFSVDGYKFAKNIASIISTQQVKDVRTLLPLQGIQWGKLCKYTKELYRSKSEDQQVKLRNIIKAIEQEQSDLIEKSPTLHTCIQSMIEMCYKDGKKKEHLFLIAWMKSFIGETLRSIRPDFESRYKKISLGLRVATEKANRADIDKYSNELKEAGQLFNTKSICFEHFIREMGQAFVNLKSNQPENTFGWKVERLPSFVSKMLQLGFPFEVMDGDTGMLPLPWVSAVLLQLKEDIGEQNVYVISVLGIQSSGKSTLLNTMFGLHFEVSAGRCTRGVFMQLIKVTDRTLPFNYLLLLDTEGIRASVYEKDRRVFENELATFAIGLGNITILNIKGENTSEIEDFLQIAVHACLRLKMANKNLKMQQKCVFVHQNVSAHDAFIKLQEERETLMLRLDEMVKDAASYEDRSDIYSFNQVIGINPDKDVWYFPDLWQGEPPMATVTLGYSAKVSSLKNHILYNIAKSWGTSYSISDTIIRIEDFCRGILTDDFVFSFQNSLEIKAYREMESFFQSLTWKPACDADDFISSTVCEKIARCTNDEDLEMICEQYSQELRETLTNTFVMKQDEFMDFVNKSRFKNLMERYTQSRTLQLEELTQLLIQKGTSDIQRHKSRHQSSLLQISKKTKHKAELRNKAQFLVVKCQTDELSDEDTVKHFNNMWEKWIEGIKSFRNENSVSIEKLIDTKLFEMFKADKPHLENEIREQRPFPDKYRKMKALTGSIELNQLRDDHVTPRTDISHIQCKRGAFRTINIIMKKVDTYISSLQKQYLQFKESYATKVFMILIESLKTNNSDINNSFLLTALLRAKLAVHVKMYIVEVFTYLNDEWQEKNDLIKQMQREKKTYLFDFICSVKDKTLEARMAKLFLSQIEMFVIETVSQKLPSDVVKSIIPDTFTTKYGLMIDIMKDLVHRSDFNEFIQYIDDSSLYALDWLTKYINEILFTTNRKDDETHYTQIAEKHMNRILEKTKQSIDHATEEMSSDVIQKNDRKKQNISLWSTLFEESLGQSFTVTKGSFLTDTGEEILDFHNYRKFILDGFETLKSNVKHRFKSHNAQNVKWSNSPYQRVFNELWGCIEHCPFCKESCQKRANHKQESHSCIQHRPPAVWGVRDSMSQVMTWMPCNCLVFSDQAFYCSASNMKCQSSGICKDNDENTTHLYREYSTLIPAWVIEPSPLHEPPKYWIWFISKYQNQLCEAYNYKAYEHIDEWEIPSENDAISSLTRISKLSQE